MRGSWHDFEIWKERRRDLLGEAEARRIARAARPPWRERLEKYLRLLDRVGERILGHGTEAVPSQRAYPQVEDVAPSGMRAGLVEAQVRPSSVIEFHQEVEGYVIREVDLGTGDHILYLSTEEPERAAWIWERTVRG